MRSRFSRVLLPLAVAVSISLLLPTAAAAWGGIGHQIIALIAEERLTETARDGIQELLGDGRISDAEVVNWADEVRRERRDTAPWHYVNIPASATQFAAERDGNGGDNVIEAIERQAAILSDSSRPRADRQEALKFVVHFVGDLHQPLHCAERNGDKGGNTRLVFFLDQRRAVSLHRVWDTLILQRAMQGRRVAEFASLLASKPTPKETKAWAEGTIVDWVNESHRLAVDVAYAGVQSDGDPPKLTTEYVDRSQDVVTGQLTKAGLRLARLLNSLLDDAPSGAKSERDVSLPTQQPPSTVGDAPSR